MEYYDAISKGYNFLYKDEQLIKWNKAKRLIDIHGLVLDIGCGTGLITKRIPKVIGIDISYKMLKKCSKDLRLINANAEKLPFLDNVFDTIISFTVLQDVKDIKKAVSEIRRVLKKDGNILITVLNKNKIKKIRELLKKEFKNLKEENIGKDIAFFT